MGTFDEIEFLSEEYSRYYKSLHGEYPKSFQEETCDYQEEEDSEEAYTSVVIHDKFLISSSYNETLDLELGPLVKPEVVMPPCVEMVKMENDCVYDDYEIGYESIPSKHDTKTPPKQEVQTIESNIILTPPRSPETGESSTTESFSTNDLQEQTQFKQSGMTPEQTQFKHSGMTPEQAQFKQSGMTPPLSPEEPTLVTRCLGELIEEADLTSSGVLYKDDPLEEEDDDNDVDEEEEIIAEERMRQLYRMQEESNSSEEWIRSREKSIARPINPTENDHSYYKGMHSEEMAYEYYFTPSESEDSEVDVVSLPSRQQQIREQQYLAQLQKQALPQLMQLQKQALPQQEPKPQRLQPQRLQPQRRQPQRRQGRQSTPTKEVQPVRQVRQRGRKPAAKGKSSMPNKVSPAESLDNSSETPMIPTEEKVTRGGTKRKAANKSSGPATKRRRGRACGRDMMPAEKREQHNNMERKRRVDIANLYSDLRATIPEIKHLEKASKAKILNLAIREVTEFISLRRSLLKIKKAEKLRRLDLIARKESLVRTMTKRGELQYATKKTINNLLYTPIFVGEDSDNDADYMSD